MPLLIDLHKTALKRVGNDTDRVLPRALRKFGPLVVNETLLEDLAATYGITMAEFNEAEAMHELGPDVVAPKQPQRDGDYDMALLRSECEEVLIDNTRTLPLAEALATIGDPRLSRRISLVGTIPGGIRWASMLRPHEVEELHYDDLKIIWHDAAVWKFDFIDWRQRGFLVRESTPWDLMMDTVREDSTASGLEWSLKYQGKRPAI
jgi:hypothetical protein